MTVLLLLRHLNQLRYPKAMRQAFIISLSGGATTVEDIEVEWEVSCGGDISVEDFEGSSCPSGTATIKAGRAFATFAVLTNDDNVVEGLEEIASTVLNLRECITSYIGSYNYLCRYEHCGYRVSG